VGRGAVAATGRETSAFRLRTVKPCGYYVKAVFPGKYAYSDGQGTTKGTVPRKTTHSAGVPTQPPAACAGRNRKAGFSEGVSS
jgi:hypothetical protein